MLWCWPQWYVYVSWYNTGLHCVYTIWACRAGTRAQYIYISIHQAVYYSGKEVCSIMYNCLYHIVLYRQTIMYSDNNIYQQYCALPFNAVCTARAIFIWLHHIVKGSVYFEGIIYLIALHCQRQCVLRGHYLCSSAVGQRHVGPLTKSHLHHPVAANIIIIYHLSLTFIILLLQTSSSLASSQWGILFDKMDWLIWDQMWWWCNNDLEQVLWNGCRAEWKCQKVAFARSIRNNSRRCLV